MVIQWSLVKPGLKCFAKIDMNSRSYGPCVTRNLILTLNRLLDMIEGCITNNLMYNNGM